MQRHEIDVLALQETKAREDQLPLMGLQARGYDIAVAGFNQWNGVALLSRVGLEDVEVGFAGMPRYGDPAAAEARAIGATCGGVRIWSLYVPNGRKPDDPHYVYKLDWLARLRAAADGGWRRDRAGRRLEHLPHRRRRLRRHPVRRSPPTSRRPSAPPSRASSTTARPRSPGSTRRATPTGTTTASASSATAGSRSTSCSPRPTLAARVTDAFIDRDERDPAQGTARRPTTRRWSSTSADPTGCGAGTLRIPRTTSARRSRTARPRRRTPGRSHRYVADDAGPGRRDRRTDLVAGEHPPEDNRADTAPKRSRHTPPWAARSRPSRARRR